MKKLWILTLHLLRGDSREMLTQSCEKLQCFGIIQHCLYRIQTPELHVYIEATNTIANNSHTYCQDTSIARTVCFVVPDKKIFSKFAAVTCCSSSRLRRDIRNIPFMKIRLQRKIVGGLHQTQQRLCLIPQRTPNTIPLKRDSLFKEPTCLSHLFMNKFTTRKLHSRPNPTVPAPLSVGGCGIHSSKSLLNSAKGEHSL